MVKKTRNIAIALCIGLAACATLSWSCGKSGSNKSLSLLVWEGYADPSFVAKFEEANGVKVKSTYFTSGDDLIAKLKAGGGSAYDIISPSGDTAGFLVQSGMVEAIDLGKIKNYADIDPRLILDDVAQGGKVYGVPYLWGPDYLIYDADVIPQAPSSWSVFWEPAYKGKVSLYDDISNIYLVGQMMGLDKDNPSALYNMSEEQLAAAKAKLLELQPNVRKYWVSAGELNDLFANKEVCLAVGWPLTVKEVNAKGRNLKWAIPEEGATGWIDRLMIVKGSKNISLAHKYIDYMASPEGQALSSGATTYCVVNAKSAQFMTPELIELSYVNQMDTLFSQLNFWQYVANRSRYNDVWTEVKTSN